MLTNCDKEPIHIIGKIQSHAYLFAFNAAEKHITHISENLLTLLNITVTDAAKLQAGELLKSLLGPTTEFNLAEHLQLNEDGQTEAKAFTTEFMLNDVLHIMHAHNAGDKILMDIEPQPPTIIDHNELWLKLSALIESNEGEATDFSQYAKTVKELIGYDRVMIYKFEEDDHGVVIAEAKDDDVESLMNLHFPASDIPMQARELYKKNYARVIADVDSQTIDVLDVSGSQAPLDMTYSQVRAVSPVHIEYLRNMHVKASYSISIVIKDRLWGLIACHNASPKFIDFKSREITKVISFQLAANIQRERSLNLAGKMLKVARIKNKITAVDLQDGKLSDRILGLSKEIATIIPHDGMAILFENELQRTGATLQSQQLMELANTVFEQENKDTYSSNSIEELGIKDCEDVAGFIACRLGSNEDFLFLFRQPLSKSISWAGNPEKLKMEDGKIHPRNSFETWTQSVSCESVEFNENDHIIIGEIRNSVLLAISEWNILQNLQQSQAFSYMVSHDLKLPLSAIKNYTELLQADEEKFSGEEVELLNRITTTTDKMASLIQNMLQLSRIDRGISNHSKIDMQLLLNEVSAEVKNAYSKRAATINLQNIIDINGDETLIRSVFENIISNAVKYTPHDKDVMVTVNATKNSGNIVYSIEDKGSGIEAADSLNIFKDFSRGHNQGTASGHGIGLSTAKKIISLHKGKIWFDTAPGEGTTFFIQFPG